MNADFLKYDASSLQELLRRKLLESGLYTDQIYPGSDTRILIDLFSWTFDVLTYILNNNAADALFQDTEIYENLNKIVKLLSYNPRGYTTSFAEFSIDGSFDENETMTCTIPRFSYIEIPKSSNKGGMIRYSFINDYTFNVINGMIIPSKNNPILYNGEFVHYVFDELAQGIPYEIFTMIDVSPNGSIPTYIDNDNIYVFIEKINNQGIQEYYEVGRVNNLILDASINDDVCEIRFNENKEVTIKFGDDLHGKKLAEGSKVHVIYLSSDGANGQVDASELYSFEVKLGITNVNSLTELINMVYDGINVFKLAYSNLFIENSLPVYSINKIYLTNLFNSSPVKDYESVSEIKEHAPSNFRLGNRLVSASDYRTFILSNFSNRIADVYVCNNNSYCTTFYKWLHEYGYLNANIRLSNYTYANACDFNNIYLWLKPVKSQLIYEYDKKYIIKQCEDKKILTTNLIPCDAIETYFMPFFKHKSCNDGCDSFNITEQEIDSNYYHGVKSGDNEWGTKILIQKGKTYLSDNKIISNVLEIIIDYFNVNGQLGGTINLADLYQKILSLGYIESIKTVSTFIDQNNNSHSAYCEGLSFAKFTSSIINFKDFDFFTQYYTLEKFQYATLLNPDAIKNQLVVLSENTFLLKNTEF